MAKTRLWLGVFIAYLVTGIPSLKAENRPLVVASLKPLALIAQEVAGDKADLEILLPVTASHHDYPMKTSDYVLLKRASLIIWVGPELESFLKKPLSDKPAEELLTASQLTGIHWPVMTPEEDERDPHLWLDPRNAAVLAAALADRLSRADEANGQVYRQNAQVFAEKMRNLDDRIMKEMRPLGGLGFAVYHEGFGHFVQHYGLRQLGYVTFTPEQRPGAKHLHLLREKLAADGKCLFLEPQNDQQSLRDLAQELHLRLGTLDIMGDQSVTTYSQLIERIAREFSNCLANGRAQ